jgi:hypothetical protein
MASSSSVAAAGEAQIKIAGSAVSRALLNFTPSVVAFEFAKFSEFTPRRVKKMALLEQLQQTWFLHGITFLALSYIWPRRQQRSN